VVSVSPRLEGEPLELLSALLAHEAIHCDRAGGIQEEIVATALDTLLYIQFLGINPALARHQSLLSKDLNIDAIAMINSGRRLPESIGVLPSPGVESAIPNTNAAAMSFAELIAAAYEGQPLESESEPLAALYVATLAQSVGIGASDPWDLEYLDFVLGSFLHPSILLFAISTLGLEPAA
jgi:hypothetical protein